MIAEGTMWTPRGVEKIAIRVMAGRYRLVAEIVASAALREKEG